MERGALGLLLKALRLVGAAPCMSRSLPHRVSSASVIYGRLTSTLLSVSLIIGEIYLLDDYLYYTEIVYGIMVSGRACLVFIMLKATFSGPERVTRMARFLDTLREVEGNITLKLKYEFCTVGFIFSYLIVYNITIIYPNFQNGGNATFYLLLATTFSITNIINAQIILFARRIKNTLKKMNDDLQQLTFEESIKCKEEKQQDRAIIHKIRKFSRRYESICNIVRTNTREDGLLLGAMMTFTMIELNIYSYNIFLRAIDDYLIFVELTMWSLHLLHLVLAVDPFHQTHTEFQRTTCLASELQSRVDENEQASCELLMFVHRLALDKPLYRPLEMFTIDRSLAVKIFGSLTTYLLIMLT